MQAEDEQGQLVEAYCYVYNTDNGQLVGKIADGDFKRYIAFAPSMSHEREE